jgi:peptide/nickel transport system substrate-binding protein
MRKDFIVSPTRRHEGAKTQKTFVSSCLCVFALIILITCGPRPTATPTPLPTLLEDPHTLTPPPPSVPSVTPLAVESSVKSVDLCLADEPQSLYLYARPEAGRAHLLAALYDGPIDHVNDEYQPVLLEKLPSVNDGDAVVRDVTLNAGDTAVDDIGRVVTLTEGVTVNLLNGEQITYSGSGPIAAPQMTVTFRLRPGVRWSDGQPLTADDSVFSYRVSLSPDSFNPRRALAERTAAYRALDDTTVEWVGLPGYIDPLYFTNFWSPLPRHRFTDMTPGQIADSDEANYNPLGWGPFVLKEWARGDQLTFERNPYYFRASEGLPEADMLTYRIVTDATQIVDSLRSGQCAIAPSSPALESALDTLAQLQFAHTVSSTALAYLHFGIRPAANYARAVGHDFFAGARARQAIAHCLTWLSPLTPDPARGRALLAELGWTDSGGDGFLDKDGIRLSLTLAGFNLQSPISNFQSPVSNLQSQLQTNCGIAVELLPLTRGEFTGDWPDGVVFGRRFDLAVLTWDEGGGWPCELWLTEQLPDDANPGGANASGYSNPAFDAACRRARATLDPALAAHYRAEAQQLFAQDLPALPLFFRVKVAAALPGVQGFALDPTSDSELWAIEAIAP